jgi:hypothetical protein
MKIQIDLKSASCGLAIGVAAMFVMGAESSSNPVGRYQIEIGVPGAVILDTQTGEAWAMPNTGSGNFDSKSGKFYGPKNE